MSLGTVVIKKEDIAKYKASRTVYHKYLYVIIKKPQNVKVNYNHVEGQFIFVSMDYIYSTIPKGFLISSHLSEGQRTPHLYAFDGRNMTIEIIYLGDELVYKILKYKLYQTGSEELYADYDGFIIKRRKEKNKIYIDVSQKINKTEGNTTPNQLIFCIFSKNEGHVASGNVESISYSMKYHSLIETNENNHFKMIIIIAAITLLVLAVILTIIIIIKKCNAKKEVSVDQINEALNAQKIDE